VTDGVDEILRNFRAAFERELAAASERLRAASARPASDEPDPRPDMGFKDLIAAAKGAELAHRAKSTMNSWCGKHPVTGDAGFAVKIGSRWFVSRSRLIRHLADEAKSSGSSD
jgi:hypothetical protein